MSNIIKYNYVNVTQNEKRVIDLSEREALFQAIALRNEKQSKENSSEPVSGEFIEGLNAPVLEVVSDEEQEQEKAARIAALEEKAGHIIDKAKAEAEEILNNARLEAELLREQIQNEAKEQGYQTGLHQANQEIKDKEAELNNQIQQNQAEYEALTASLEPKFVDLMAAYIEKITGVVVSDRKDVILHLISNAISGSEQSKSSVIKVSKAEYDNVSEHWTDLETFVKQGVELELYEDNTLNENQCLIETNGSVIDCSLDVQLNNLITDLKLLAL